jgi:AcrR family transcriptional regulator
MDAREQLLRAALTVFAELGSRGATTRRIAQVAGVNEVTLFRHFGSKDALLREALAWAAERSLTATLPDKPVDPEAELLAFCRQHHRALVEARSLIRKCMSEFEERPNMTDLACRAPVAVSQGLHTYLVKLRAAGLASGDWNSRAAAAMLMGTIFGDAMGRDCMPQKFPHSEKEALRQYVTLFLRAIGASPAVTRASRSSSTITGVDVVRA